MNKTTLQIKEHQIQNPEDYQKGYKDGQTEVIEEIKKMAKYLHRDDVVRFLQE